MSTTPPILDGPDRASAYQAVYDALSDAYWHASDLQSKDLIHGTMESIASIVTALDEAELEGNTSAFIALLPQVQAVNKSLDEIKTSINQITRDFSTASEVLAAVNKVLSMAAMA